MVKKILPIFAVIVVLTLICVSLLAKRAPQIIENLLADGLNKEVSLGKVNYHFPLAFEINQLAINETGAFRGENTFFVEKAIAHIQPYELWKRRLIIDHIDIVAPQITVRKHRGKLYHAFNPEHDLTVDADDQVAEQKVVATQTGRTKETLVAPLVIRKLKIQKGVMRWIDYDVDEKGFVVTLQEVNAEVEDLSLLPNPMPVKFTITSFMNQGRDLGPAHLSAKGWYHLMSQDIEAQMNMDSLWIPFFRPYYHKVTPSQINDGEMAIQSTTVVKNRDWTTNARVSLRRLQFDAVEEGNQILGFDANAIFDILRTNDGQVNLDVVTRWDMKDPNMNFQKALQKSLRHSIKSTFLMNIDNVVSNTLERISEEGTDFLKQDWKNLIKKENLNDVLGELLKISE